MLLAKAIVIVCFSLFIARIWYQMNTIVHVNLVLKPLFSFHSFSFLIHLVWITLCWLFFALSLYFWFGNSQCSECYCHTVTTDVMIYPMLLRCCCSTRQNAFGNSMKAKHYHGIVPHRTVPHRSVYEHVLFGLFFNCVCTHMPTMFKL